MKHGTNGDLLHSQDSSFHFQSSARWILPSDTNLTIITTDDSYSATPSVNLPASPITRQNPTYCMSTSASYDFQNDDSSQTCVNCRQPRVWQINGHQKNRSIETHMLCNKDRLQPLNVMPGRSPFHCLRTFVTTDLIPTAYRFNFSAIIRRQNGSITFMLYTTCSSFHCCLIAMFDCLMSTTYDNNNSQTPT